MKNFKNVDKGKSEKAYVEIKNFILALRSSPNEPLSELKLAAQLGMSRTPVREALKRLENEGILVSYGKRGTFINIPTKDEIKDIFQVRLFLETAATKLATNKLNKNRLKEFEAQMNKFREGSGSGDFVELGRKFHFFIIESSGNKELIDILRILYMKLDMIRLFSYSFRRKEAVDEHLDIIDALQKGDEELSYICMQNHLKNAFNTLTNIL